MVFLPTEVWQNVFRHIPYDSSRYNTLYNWCLVSRTTRHLAQPFLFSWITDEHDKKRYRVFPSITRILWHYKYLRQHVHEIDVTNWHCDDLRNPRAHEIMKQLGTPFGEFRAETFPDMLLPNLTALANTEGHLSYGGPFIDTGHIIFLCSLCPNLETLGFVKHETMSFGDIEIPDTVWPNLREISISRTICGDEDYTIDEVASLLATPNLRKAHLTNFTFGSDMVPLESASGLKELLLIDCWFTGDAFEQMVEAYPLLESYQHVNPHELSINAAEEWFDDFTPGAAVEHLTKLKWSLRELTLDLFYYPKASDNEWLPSTFVARHLYCLTSLQTLSIDIQSILGAGLFYPNNQHMRTGPKHPGKPLKELFPKSVKELGLTHISANVKPHLRWLADNVNEELPNLKRLSIDFGRKWLEMDMSTSRSSAVLNKLVVISLPEVITATFKMTADLIPDVWMDIIADFFHAGIEVNVGIEGSTSSLYITQEILNDCDASRVSQT